MEDYQKLNKQHLISDLDGTLYRLPDEFHENCLNAAVKTVEHYGIDCSTEEKRNEIKALAAKSACDCGYEMQALVDKYHLPFKEAEDFFLRQRDIGTFKPDMELVDMFRATKKTLGILTHVTTKHARRILAQLHIDDLVSDDHIVGIDSYNHERKNISPRGFKFIAAQMGIDPSEAIFVDDTAANLKTAHALGMTTVLVRNYGPLTEEESKFVDFKFETPKDLMHTLLEQERNAATETVPEHRFTQNEIPPADRVAPREAIQPRRLGSSSAGVVPGFPS